MIQAQHPSPALLNCTGYKLPPRFITTPSNTSAQAARLVDRDRLQSARAMPSTDGDAWGVLAPSGLLANFSPRMLLNQKPYPFTAVSVEDAQRIWQLAEQEYESKSEQSPLLLAVRALGRTAYRELITLACMGRGHDSSFDCKRAHAEAEHSHDYLALNCPRLHCYLRHALGSFGVPPVHQLNERNYPAENRDEQMLVR